MPDFIRNFLGWLRDRSAARTAFMAGSDDHGDFLPGSAWHAIGRGAANRCPRCGDAPLFRKFLKPVAQCQQCGQEWTWQQADDFPAYISILVTGHLMAPLIIALTRKTDLSVAALMAIVLSLAVVLMVGMLQPAKGGVIALQWWFGMHGFRKERREVMADEAD